MEDNEPSAYRKNLEFLLSVVCKCGASDLCLKPNTPPVVNIHGQKVACKLSALTSADIDALALSLMDVEQKNALDRYSSVVFAYEMPRLGCFRVSFYRKRSGVLLTARVVSGKAKD